MSTGKWYDGVRYTCGLVMLKSSGVVTRRILTNTQDVRWIIFSCTRPSITLANVIADLGWSGQIGATNDNPIHVAFCSQRDKPEMSRTLRWVVTHLNLRSWNPHYLTSNRHNLMSRETADTIFSKQSVTRTLSNDLLARYPHHGGFLQEATCDIS